MKNIQSAKQGKGSNRGFCIVCFTLVLVLAILSIIFTGCDTKGKGPCQHQEVIDQGKPATCLENGLTEGKHCALCNTVLVPQQKIPMLGHDIVQYEAKAPTCTEVGWEAYEACSRGDYSTYVEIPMLEHRPSSKVTENVVEATCIKEGGYDKVVYCRDCNGEMSREHIVTTGTHNLERHEAKAPTCTEIGWKAYDTCTWCDYSTYEELAPIPHTPQEAVVENEVIATCAVNGGYDLVVYCSVCDGEISREHIVTTEPHDVIINEAKAPTCDDIGWEEYETCSRCSYTTYVELAPRHTEVVDPATVTCTQAGLSEGKHCSICGENTLKQEVVDALGHIEVVDKYVAPTCTETGLTEGSHCDRCKIALIEQQVIDALGHEITVHEAKEHTCTEIGWDEYETCSRCDYSTYKEIQPSHTEATVLATVTCTEAGYTEEIYCAVCEEILVAKEFVGALGHDVVVDEYVAPTC
ncbi:MAG: hypothetical protein J6S32_00730, partial [Clostridia bacterium]|nr:hypothetical protein [Clostridia bacterium]